MNQIKIEPHFLDNTTELPLYIVQRHLWRVSGNYKIDLALGHFIGRLLNHQNYLILNCGYGTFADALLDLGKDVVSVDYNEAEYDVLSDKVKKTFRIADISSPSLTINLFDNVVSINFIEMEDDISFFNFIDFCKRHSNFYILLMGILFNRPLSVWIAEFDKRGFRYKPDMVESIMSLKTKFYHQKMNNVLIFENKFPKIEDYG